MTNIIPLGPEDMLPQIRIRARQLGGFFGVSISEDHDGTYFYVLVHEDSLEHADTLAKEFSNWRFEIYPMSGYKPASS